MTTQFGTPPVGEEFFDVVDEQDVVIGQAPRSVVHRDGLLHRACHIFVFNSKGEMLLHRRSGDKDEFPLVWSTSASGHVSAGESYDESAQRETFEEIGLTGPLELLAKFPPSKETSNEHVCVYRMTSDQTPTFDPGEIIEGRFISLDEIDEWVSRAPQEFTPSFVLLFRWYCEKFVSGNSK
jgi:Isopentenyldiphosphate isomerase